jgi:hypothetical protein
VLCLLSAVMGGGVRSSSVMRANTVRAIGGCGDVTNKWVEVGIGSRTVCR